MPLPRSQSSAVLISALAAFSSSRVEKAPEAGARAEALLGRHLERQMVDMRRDAAHRLAVALGEEILRLGMAEPAILLRADRRCHLVTQRRHPVRIAGIERVGDLDKALVSRLVVTGRMLSGPLGKESPFLGLIQRNAVLRRGASVKHGVAAGGGASS
jgi:hypothetical protein